MRMTAHDCHIRQDSPLKRFLSPLVEPDLWLAQIDYVDRRRPRIMLRRAGTLTSCLPRKIIPRVLYIMFRSHDPEAC